MPRWPELTESERFWEKVNKNGPVILGYEELGPCYLWVRRKFYNGYGQFKLSAIDGIPGSNIGAHRWAWIETHGPISEFVELDHLCHTYTLSCNEKINCLHRSCVNVNHLQLVTHAENMLRGRGLIHLRLRALDGL